MGILTADKTAPNWQLTSVDGKKYSLKEGLSKGPVLLGFFKAECPVCQFTFPFLERLYQQLKAKGIRLWGVSQDNARATQRFAKEYGLTFPLLIDDYPYETSRNYRLEYVPSLILIGTDGKISIASEGFSKADLLAIQKALAQHHAVVPPALFQPHEQIPEYRPG
jgi:peroxiredoxin